LWEANGSEFHDLPPKQQHVDGAWRAWDAVLVLDQQPSTQGIGGHPCAAHPLETVARKPMGGQFLVERMVGLHEPIESNAHPFRGGVQCEIEPGRHPDDIGNLRIWKQNEMALQGFLQLFTLLRQVAFLSRGGVNRGHHGRHLFQKAEGHVHGEGVV
jgi:hypothetical protein